MVGNVTDGSYLIPNGHRGHELQNSDHLSRRSSQLWRRRKTASISQHRSRRTTVLLCRRGSRKLRALQLRIALQSGKRPHNRERNAVSNYGVSLPLSSARYRKSREPYHSCQSFPDRQRTKRDVVVLGTLVLEGTRKRVLP